MFAKADESVRRVRSLPPKLLKGEKQQQLRQLPRGQQQLGPRSPRRQSVVVDVNELNSEEEV